jgi:hypothetical protein
VRLKISQSLPTTSALTTPTLRGGFGPISIEACETLSCPKVGRRQMAEGVRKMVTRKYAYLIYYTVYETEDEIIILNVKHKARERGHSDI